MGAQFEFERLVVWQRAMIFIDLVFSKMDEIESDRKHYRLMEQMESACTSIAQNIAEGKGRFFGKEYLRFLYYARGSMYETITLLAIFRRRNWINEEEHQLIRQHALEISKMLNALISSIRKKVSSNSN